MLHIACRCALNSVKTVKTVKTNQTAWNAALRQAVIRVKSDYFALSETERENYRLHMNTEDEFRIQQTILKELFGIAVNTTEELDSILDTFDDSQYLLLNSTLLPLQGIGEDNFFLNEYLPTDVTLLDFSTVGDYARDDHLSFPKTHITHYQAANRS